MGYIYPMQPDIHAQTIAKLDAYQARTGLSDRQLGMAVFKDHKMIKRLREGRATLRSIAKLEAAMAAEGEAG